MEFVTKVDIPLSDLSISYRHKILMLGSCFIENVGKILIDNKFDSMLNPFGVLYNPSSIAEALRILSESKTFTREDIFNSRGLYHSFHFHSSFSDMDESTFLRRINDQVEQARIVLQQTDILFITFGTAYVFHSIEKDMIVGNCHKLPASEFDRYRLPTDHIVTEWHELIESLREKNPSLKILFTVSPIRHFKDGAHENQLSKSTLLLAIDRLIQQNKDLYYFPSYEIVLDELRDYRFYSEDMVHPSTTAIKYIWERFQQAFMEKETLATQEEWKKIALAINHRPLNESGSEYKSFLRQTLLKLKTFNDKYPYICCENEISDLESRL